MWSTLYHYAMLNNDYTHSMKKHTLPPSGNLKTSLRSEMMSPSSQFFWGGGGGIFRTSSTASVTFQ